MAVHYRIPVIKAVHSMASLYRHVTALIASRNMYYSHCTISAFAMYRIISGVTRCYSNDSRISYYDCPELRESLCTSSSYILTLHLDRNWPDHLNQGLTAATYSRSCSCPQNWMPSSSHYLSQTLINISIAGRYGSQGGVGGGGSDRFGRKGLNRGGFATGANQATRQRVWYRS